MSFLVVALSTGIALAGSSPDTIIDSGPASGSVLNTNTATFTFHSTKSASTFTCSLDGGSYVSCTSPQTYSNLSDGSHTFYVRATSRGSTDPSPATRAWKVDTTNPIAPTNLAGNATTATSVVLTWTAGSDANLAGYDIFRDNQLLASIGLQITFTDATATGGNTYSYQARSRDAAGNVSPLTGGVSIVTPIPLTRMPYLTDLTGLNVIVNFATDQSAGATGTASVRFGPVTGGSCQLTTTVPASKTGLQVGSVNEYQWKANIVLPATGQYCYRPYLGATDLLTTSASPTFQSQVPVGSADSYSFAVFGDWGQTDGSGANVYQAGVMSQIAASGVRFAVTTGDNGYPYGAQSDYGDIRQPVSGIFGMPFWGGVGANLAVFPIIGNHGFARGDAVHPHFANWPQDATVASSVGAAKMTAYPSLNGSTPATLPDSWYAFSAGNARFYMLTATWADLNVGSGTAYSEDYLAHWATTAPEYQWLAADLAANPSGLKFAFFHYPLYSDQPAENGDTFLQGNSSLEGLLASNGVNLGFSGHAHIYQRNSPATGTDRQSLVTYVTGGGGAQAQSTGACSSNDQYAVGWSYTKNLGTACGGASVPTSPAQVHHFLKVTVNGNTVTVTPTDSTGRTFDVQAYTFNHQPDTFIDSGPAVASNSSSATFAFHATSATATYTCQLDAGSASACTSPQNYYGLGNGSHTFTVQATVGGALDPTPATYTWTVDTIAPTTPGSFAAGATSPSSVVLTWTTSMDNVGVTGYDIYRDGSFLTTIGPATGYTDAAVLGSETHTYAVGARDIAGNVSPLTGTIQVTTPAPPVPLFTDGFESGTLNAWVVSGGLTVQGAKVHGGAFAAEGNTTTGATYAKSALPGPFADGYARAWFRVVSQIDQINLLRLRDGAPSVANSIGYVYIATTGQLGFHNDATNTNITSATVPGPGWHALELHILTGASGAVDVWLDNVLVADLSGTGVNTGTATIGGLQIGDVQGGRTYDVVFDDVAFATSRLGPVADSGPTTPVATATASNPFASVTLTWTASTDDLGVAGYDVYRDGLLVAYNVNALSYFDPNILASTTYSYTVQARDSSANLSAMSAPAVVTTPAAQGVFADGFESGNMSAWTTSAGLVAEQTTVHWGTWAAEGLTTGAGANAKASISGSPADVYARIWFYIQNQVSNVTLVGFRKGNSTIGSVYVVGSSGRLAVVGVSGSTSYASATGPTWNAWHSLEFHFRASGASSTSEVWLDGVLLTDLSRTINAGTATSVDTFQLGDTQGSGRSYDVFYDDAAFGTARIGP